MIINFILEIVLYILFKPVLLAITLGKFPRKECEKKDIQIAIWIAVGLLVTSWVGIAVFNNYASKLT